MVYLRVVFENSWFVLYGNIKQPTTSSKALQLYFRHSHNFSMASAFCFFSCTAGYMPDHRAFGLVPFSVLFSVLTTIIGNVKTSLWHSSTMGI